ncbi:MAG: MFS transporter [Anaerolineae bacterium]|jgi:FSR family fosmidomycin resistance protein-like MFS transporter|nr:MFS transporter [Anaerolineae bacterium]
MLFLRLTVRRLRSVGLFVFVLLAIEFLDELVFGAREVALPLIRDEFKLSYEQIGLLLTLPPVLADLLFEPIVGILGDQGFRRRLLLGGGVLFGISLILMAASQSYLMLMIATILINPASGSFVNLAQAALMDHAPTRHEQNMARWTLAGSLGAVVGTLSIGVFVNMGWGWREVFLAAAIGTFWVLWIARRFPFDPSVEDEDESDETETFWQGLRGALGALRRGVVVRWLVLLEASDLMLDGLHAYLALYFVDVVGVTALEAGVAVSVWMGFGLIGDVLLIPLLERVNGVRYLRWSAAMEFVLYTLFLIVPGVWFKIALLIPIGILNAGWYAILQANLYTSLPGQSGRVMTISNYFGVLANFLPLIIGVIAERVGLAQAMIFPLIGCLALWFGLPRRLPDHQG